MKRVIEKYAWLDKDPRNPNPAWLLGRLEDSRNNWEKAQDYYQKALQARPDFPPAANDLAYSMLVHGGILTIKAHNSTDGVVIELADTGCGISAADLQNIFKPFFTTKADTSASPGTSGSGLGLAFCKRVIDAHHGSVSVESAPGKGTTFTIILPKQQSGNS